MSWLSSDHGFTARARRVLASPARLSSLLRRAVKLLDDSGTAAEAMASLRDDLRTSVALLKAWLGGEYREIRTSSLLLVTTALVYFVVPVDAIPDLLPVGGFVDDAAVLAFVVTQIGEELDAFRSWQAQSTAITL